MNAKTFVDTNILIYAHDEDEPMKRSAASARLLALAKSGSLALSPQVLQEFYVNATRKLAKPLPKGAARQIVEDFSGWCISTGPTEVMMACRIEDESGISFWDALICASALKAGAQTILSEDLNHGQKIAGIEIESPFRTHGA
ncbi:MAG TPA: PIN domain-containing protein [Acidobacteriaceae bacterium]|nr:PIN domain-containing protein [Acidobacteriaceae bacterium]